MRDRGGGGRAGRRGRGAGGDRHRGRSRTRRSSRRIAAHPDRSPSGSTPRRRGRASAAGSTGSGEGLLDVVPRFADAGVEALVVTDIARDGTLSGPDLDGLAAVLARTSLAGHRVGRRRRARRPRGAGRTRGRRSAARGGDRRPGASTRVGSAWVTPWLRWPTARFLADAHHPGDPVPRRRRGPRRQGRQLRRVCATPAIRSSWPRATTPRAPTSSSSSTSPRRPTAATRWSTSSAAPPSRCSSRSRSAAASASVDDARAAAAGRAPTRCRSTPPRSTSRADHRDRRRVRRPVRRRGHRRAPAPRRHGGWEVYTHGGRTPTGLDAVAWAAGGRAARRGRDPAHVDGPRRHQGRLRPRAHRARSPTRSTCR